MSYQPTMTSITSRLVGAALGLAVGLGYVAAAGGVLTSQESTTVQLVRLDPVVVTADRSTATEAARLAAACAPEQKIL